MDEGVAADGRGLRQTVKLPPSLPSRISSFPPPPPAPKPPICILPSTLPLYPFFRLPRRLRVHHPCPQSGRSIWTESTPVGCHSSLCLRNTRPRVGDGGMCDAERDPVRAKKRSRASGLVSNPPHPPLQCCFVMYGVKFRAASSTLKRGVRGVPETLGILPK